MHICRQNLDKQDSNNKWYVSDLQVASDECGSHQGHVSHRNYFDPADQPANHLAYAAQFLDTMTK